MAKRDVIEEAIRSAVREYASEHGPDNFEITVIVAMSMSGNTLDIDTDIEFTDY